MTQLTNGDTGLKARNILNTTTGLAELALGLRRPVVGFAGDSIADYTGGGQSDNTNDCVMRWDSPIMWMLALHHNADADFNVVPYNTGGYGFCVGGTNTTHLVNVQLPQVVARPPDILYVSTFQNDGITDNSKAVASVALFKTFVQGALDAGVKAVVVSGVLPYNSTTSSNRPQSLEYTNKMARAFCAATPGVYYNDVLSALKDQSGVSEVSGSPAVVYRGTAGQSGGMSADGVHLAALGGRTVGALLAPIFRKLTRALQPPDMAPVPFSNATNPWANYVGGNRGLMMGTGGTINGAADPNIPAGWALTYGANGTWAVVPTIVTGADGYRRLRLTFSGTPNADIVLELKISLSATVDAGLFRLSGMCDLINIQGMAGVQIGGTRFQAGSVLGQGNVIPGTLNETYMLRTPRLKSFQNDFNGVGFGYAVGFVSGVAASGSLDLYRFSFNREA